MIYKRLKSWFLHVLKFAFGFGIFGYFVASGQIDLTKIQSALFHSPWMAVAIVLEGAALFMVTIRWRLLLRPQGIQISYLQALKLVFIGHFFNVVIPGTVSGDLVKAYYITRRNENKMGAGFSVVMDRLVGLFGLIIITFLAVILNQEIISTIPQLKLISHAVILGFGISVVGFLIYLWKKEFSLSSRFPSFLVAVTEVLWAYRKDLPAFFKACGLTFINFAINILAFFGVALALGETAVPLTQYLFLVPIGLFVMAFPISPAGLGIGQGIFLVLFQWVLKGPTTIGADIITLFQLVAILWAFVGLIVYVLDKKKAPTQVRSSLEVLET